MTVAWPGVTLGDVVMLNRSFNRLVGEGNAPSESRGIVVTHNVDGLTDSEREQFCREASKASDVPVFQGTVEHAYGAARVATLERCPRCGGATERRYANFIYATQVALRAMFAPVGHFCTRCPSVITEEDMIEAGISDKRFEYRAVVGVDYGRKKDPDYFRTWNGEELVYFLDEDGRFESVVPRSHLEGHALQEVRYGSPAHSAVPASSSARKRAHKRQRHKMAARSRKRNRRK